MNSKTVIALLLIACVGGLVFYVSLPPTLSIETASTSEECAEVDGSWVDTSTNAGCIAANGEWKDENCSIPNYCEPTATEEKPEEQIEEEVVIPEENTK